MLSAAEKAVYLMPCKVQLADFNVQTMNLDKNYRSCPEIINFNNKVFSLDNLQDFLQRRLEDSQENKRHDIHFSETDFEADRQYLCPRPSITGQGFDRGVVRVTYLEGRVKQERADEVRQRLMPLLKICAGVLP